MPATVSNVIPLRSREPSRADDERYLQILAALEARGIFVVTEDDPIPLHASMILEPHELVGAALQAREPRIPPARGLVHEIFDLALAPFRPAGGQ